MTEIDGVSTQPFSVRPQCFQGCVGHKSVSRKLNATKQTQNLWNELVLVRFYVLSNGLRLESMNLTCSLLLFRDKEMICINLKSMKTSF